MNRTRLLLFCCVAAALGASSEPRSMAAREEAYKANNIGIGLLEQYRYDDAVAAFRKALASDPDLGLARTNLAIALFYAPDLEGARREAEAAAALDPVAPQPQYVLGLTAKGQNRPDDAVAAFQKVLAFDPTDVGANVNLGQVHLAQKRYPEAVAALRTAVAADAFNSTALYNLGIALTRAGQAEEGQKFLERFEALRKSGTGIVFSQSYPEQGRYAEAAVSSGAEPSLVDATTPEAHFVDVTQKALPGEEKRAAPAQHAGRITLADVDGDGDLDVLEVGARGERLLRNDGGTFARAAKDFGLDPALGGLGAVLGDVDGDGRPDLLVLRERGIALYHNDPEKGFVDVTAAAGLSTAPTAVTAALVDADHDGDLDILLAGAPGSDRLFRNDGKGVFTDVTDAAGLGGARPGTKAVVATDFDNHRDVDLLFLNAEGPPTLFKNMRDGSFKDVAAETGLSKAVGRFSSVAAADLNKDGYTDFFLGRAEGDLLALSDGKRGFTIVAGPGTEGSTSALFLDYDNDGLLDLLAASPKGGVRLFRNLGAGGWSDVSDKALPGSLVAESLAAGDLDGDGATDLILRLPSGALRILHNEGGAKNHSLRVRLAGKVSNRNGVGAKIDVRAGSLRQKLETYAATPQPAPADVVFGLGAREAADAVRVLWPSGILQTETETSKIAVRAASLEELDRKPSSCPYLYAWNGQRFEFVTDFMGGGEMGNQVAPGVFDTPIPEEYVRLGADQLKPRDGRYEIRVTNELEEALFVDRLRLLAVAHPADVTVFPNEGLGEAPRRALHLFAARDLHPPSSAVDDQGRDVLDRVMRLDRRFVDTFALESVRGYAREHTLEVDLGGVRSDRALLLLTGWTDYAFSSDNIAAHQRGLELHPPSLQLQDDDGRWVTAVENIGIPVGRPQTVVVDLGRLWRGRSRRARVVTNMRIYWDQVLVGTAADVSLQTAFLDPSTAELRDRGFSAELPLDGREPYRFDYARTTRVSPWKVFPGRYTRFGDVRELLAASDDLFVFSRPGDELALSFDAAALPALPAGWTRTFLLYADGFSKEMNLHSATPDSLGPLPFHGMTRYPYAAPEAYPMTAARLAVMERYNTRLVTAPVAPIEVALTEKRAAPVP
ncbi:MAG: FG-GAP-like repeat-containing protein [Vicinamibacteria bacterium]